MMGGMSVVGVFSLVVVSFQGIFFFYFDLLLCSDVRVVNHAAPT